MNLIKCPFMESNNRTDNEEITLVYNYSNFKN